MRYSKITKMILLILAAAFSAVAMAGFWPALTMTATGIRIDTAWKQKIYDFAVKNVRHPSWGLSHSERDYWIARKIAEAQGISLDLDVLFAAAFLHDLGGIGSFALPGVDHAVRSVQLVPPLLQDWGFPMEKWPALKEMILGHTYYGPVPASNAALAFRDADILDFLGSMGVARILAITEETGSSSATLVEPIKTLRVFAHSMSEKLSIPASRDLAEPRINELNAFLQSFFVESFRGKAQ